MTTDTDRIQKRVVLRAPLARVWSAVSDASQFGSWFGVAFEGSFAPGKIMKGTIVPTTVDAEVAKTQQPYAGAKFDFTASIDGNVMTLKSGAKTYTLKKPAD